MKLEDLQDATGQLDDNLVTEAGIARRNKKRPPWLRAGAVAAALILILTGFAITRFMRRPGDITVSGVAALATPEYPVMHKQPSEYMLFGGPAGQKTYEEAHTNWWNDVKKQRNQPKGYQDGILTFAQAANPLILAGKEENRIYSPLSIYLTLSLLAETAAGDTRAEILQALGVDTIENLRQKAGSLWNAHYINDGHTTSLLANSIWFDKSLPVKKATMQILQDTYKAAAFQGKMESKAMTKQLQKWLNEQTDGLLKSNVDKAGFEKDTLMALASTILFRAKWTDEFSDRDTSKSTFNSPAGPVETDFMYESGTNTYYWGDNFSAISKPLTNAGSMWFFLPDDGVEADELLDSLQINAVLQDCSAYEQQKFLIVNFKVPKFDVMSELQLKEPLKALGVKSAFTDAADFSTVSEDANLYVSEGKHSARVMIDEEGVTGSAYMLMSYGAAKPPDEIVDFFLDRPFLFVIQGHDGVPLFIGVVNRP